MGQLEVSHLPPCRLRMLYVPDVLHYNHTQVLSPPSWKILKVGLPWLRGGMGGYSATDSQSRNRESSPGVTQRHLEDRPCSSRQLGPIPVSRHKPVDSCGYAYSGCAFSCLKLSETGSCYVHEPGLLLSDTVSLDEPISTHLTCTLRQLLPSHQHHILYQPAGNITSSMSHSIRF